MAHNIGPIPVYMAYNIGPIPVYMAYNRGPMAYNIGPIYDEIYIDDITKVMCFLCITCENGPGLLPPFFHPRI